MKASVKKCIMIMSMAFAGVQMSAQLIFTANPEVSADDHSSVAFYEQFSYQWVDDAGVTHTSLITDEATDPNQIFELLKWAYADKRIPGTKYVYDTLDPLTTYEVPYPNGTEMSAAWDISETDDVTPDEHGFTAFVVNLKDDFEGYSTPSASVENTIELFRNTVKSVRLVTGMTRVENNTNPGYIFNCKGEYNKFYLIAKGRARDGGRDAPFRGMYEELSPGNKGPQLDVYDVLFNGESQNVYHDCASVICQSGGGHYLSLGALGETAEYELNMCLFIPDYRLVYWEYLDIMEEMPDFVHPSPPQSGNGGRDSNGDYTWYHPKYLPEFFLHTVVLDNAAATRTDDMVDAYARNYEINLDWTSKYADIEFEIDEVYAVYKIVDGDVTMVADGLTEPKYTYHEPQHSTGYEIMYYVTAQPVGMDGYDPVESNVLSVVIPGYDPLESLRLDIDGDYASSYGYRNSDPEQNDYVNTIVARNTYVIDYVAGFHLAEGTVMTFYRMLDQEGVNATPIASLTIKEVSETEIDGEWRRTFTFAIEYADGTVPEGAVTSGSVHCSAETKDALDKARVIFDDRIMVIDEFSVSTATNEQPNRYYYQLKYTAAEEIVNGEKEAHSNIVSVPVFKVWYTVDAWKYTKEQIEADTDGELTVSDSIYVTFQAQNHPEIRDYTVYRNEEIVAMAQRTQEGAYNVVTYHNGKAVESHSVASSSDSPAMISIVDDVSDFDGAQDDLRARYVIVITTFSRNFATNGGKTNTYGSVRTEEPLADVAFTDFEQIYNTNWHEEGGGTFHYVTIKNWNAYLYAYEEDNPLQLTIDGKPHYRIWRSIDGGDEELLGFSNVNYNTFEIHDERNLEVTSNDSFFYRPIDDVEEKNVEGKDFDVTYRLRAYAYDTAGYFRVAETVVTVPYKHGGVTTEKIETSTETRKMRLYPNPADTHVTIEADGFIAIYNLVGQPVLTIDDGATSRVADISHLPAGLYIVKSDAECAKLKVE